MNFVQSDFWWKLVGLGLPLTFFRMGMIHFGLWRSFFDRVSLLIFSLILFWYLSPLSFSILLVEGMVSYQVIHFLQRQANCNETSAVLSVSADEFDQAISKSNRSSLLILWSGVFILLFILAGFKYLQPIEIAKLFPTLAVFLTSLKVGMVPVGLSFHTFQMIASMVDAYRGRLTKPIRMVDYANFVFLFPQAASGPIERWSQLGSQLTKFQFSVKQFEVGLCWITLGLFMKLVLADNLMRYTKAPIADLNNAWCILIYAFIYGMRLYFDFAGYSFIALGLGKTIGIDLELNFLAPYSAINIQDFWRRWNVTLTTWFRDYLFVPLGGSRVPWVYCNIFAVFLASGIWHGSGLNYLLWGVYHGILMIGHRLWSQYWSSKLQLTPWIGRLLTWLVVIPGWIFFIESDPKRLTTIGKTLMNLASYSADNFQLESGILTLESPFFLYISIGLSSLILIVESWSIRLKKDTPYDLFITPKVSLVLLGLVILLSNRDPGQFMYFSF